MFTRQLNLAMKFNLPLVLHIRDAEADGLKVLSAVGVPSNYPIHRHCFGGDVKAARAWLGKYPCSKIGVTGLVTHQDAKDVRRVIKDVCLNKILLETDAPYHLPEGASSKFKCSFPGHVIHVAREVAKIKNIPVNTVLSQNQLNSLEIYKIFTKNSEKRKAEDDTKLFIRDLHIGRQELRIMFPKAKCIKIMTRKRMKNSIIEFESTEEATHACTVGYENSLDVRMYRKPAKRMKNNKDKKEENEQNEEDKREVKEGEAGEEDEAGQEDEKDGTGTEEEDEEYEEEDEEYEEEDEEDEEQDEEDEEQDEEDEEQDEEEEEQDEEDKEEEDAEEEEEEDNVKEEEEAEEEKEVEIDEAKEDIEEEENTFSEEEEEEEDRNGDNKIFCVIS